MNIRQYIKELRALFAHHANPDYAIPMAHYMRDQFAYYGIKSPLRRQLTRSFLHDHGPPGFDDAGRITHALWGMPERELHYFAIDLLTGMKKEWPEHALDLFQQLIVQKSWWDTVDPVSSDLVGVYFLHRPAQMQMRTREWVNSGNMWLQRTALIFQRKYKDGTNTALLFDYCTQLAGSDEFFIQKAIGWALRQHGYTDPDAVRRFVARAHLKPLSRREALKNLG